MGDEENCDLRQFEKNKYFYGKLMTVRDFETEQGYFDGKRRLINRTIHGVGIVCGLNVKDLTEKPSGSKKYIIKISPGVALDCCGNEIVVDKSYAEKEIEIEGSKTNYLYIKYDKCETESVPVPADASTCKEVCCNNKVKECFKLVWGSKPSDPTPPIVDPIKIIAGCPSCPTSESEPKVLLQVYNGMNPDETNTNKYRSLIYNNPLLYDIINDHITHGVHGGSTAGTSLPPGVMDDIADVGTKNPGSFDKYARANHSHALGSGVVVKGNLNTSLQGEIDSKVPKSPIPTTISKVGLKDEKVGTSGYALGDHTHQLNDDLKYQLNDVFSYIRGKSVKYAATTFKEAKEKFVGEDMKAIHNGLDTLETIFKAIVDDSINNNLDSKYMNFKSKFKQSGKTTIDNLKTEIGKKQSGQIDYADKFSTLLSQLSQAIANYDKPTYSDERVALDIAAILDDVSYYASLLKVNDTWEIPGWEIPGWALPPLTLDKIKEKVPEYCTRCKPREVERGQELVQPVVQIITEMPGITRTGIEKELEKQGVSYTSTTLGAVLNSFKEYSNEFREYGK